MNLVDSSGWLEYFANGKNASFFAKPLEDPKNLIVPTICLFEVFKRIIQQRKDDRALEAIALMHQGQVVDLNSQLSVEAGKLSYDLKLPMADSIILATAKIFEATIWTQDSDFRAIAGVKFIESKS